MGTQAMSFVRCKQERGLFGNLLSPYIQSTSYKEPLEGSLTALHATLSMQSYKSGGRETSELLLDGAVFFSDSAAVAPPHGRPRLEKQVQLTARKPPELAVLDKAATLQSNDLGNAE